MTAADPLFSLAGKTALVTGGGTGIGAMIAAGLVRRGVKTYIAGRDSARIEEAASRLSQGGTCIGLGGDLAHETGPVALASEFARREERLDILVNNAGASATGSLA